ncbi:unnamed protein product [Parascedosporium putredinis]|uniref:PNPLA domain-containing protein n=1 Tax=Parascedosporium putredinis TaxID=1442378 RepID=A0A9P1MC17_9PEZI|nr:unnamed protein product [Parascedosporium putredinis]CAI7997548.1 unnamed protein product [Parascedosporium putredinis]
MLSPSELKGLPTLPEAVVGFDDGTYSVSSHKESSLIAEGPEVVNKIWFPSEKELIQRIHSLQLIAKSHDQGYSDDEFSASWTWFEIAILKHKNSRHPRVKDGIELVWNSHRNALRSSEFTWAKFGQDHDLFRLLEDGNVLGIRLCARFQNWEIVAKKGYLLFNIASAMTRDPLRYGQTKDTIMSIQEVFQEVNSSIFPESMQISTPDNALLFRAEMLTSVGERPLRVLSLGTKDGGGVRGVAALMILEEVMKKVAPGKKPCEVFDMIGGTSTGGFIAIMLGRLQMSIQECLTKYKEFMSVVFPGSRYTNWSLVRKGAKWDATELEKVIKKLVKEKLQTNPDEVLLYDEETSATCKVFVMATRSEGSNNQAPVVFRSYENSLEKSEFAGIKLWEAARATSAAPSYFDPLKVGGHEFLDGGLQANNPLGWLWNEVLSVFGPARSTSCFLSIGTGVPLRAAVHDRNGQHPLPLSAQRLRPRPMGKKYWRFNVGDGLPDCVEEDGAWKWKLRGQRVEDKVGELDDVKVIPTTERKAKEYIQHPDAQKMMDECAQALKEEHVSTLDAKA